MSFIRLQLFAEEKRESPTLRRRQQARQRGQVARSAELTSAVVLVVTFGALALTWPSLHREVSDLLTGYMSWSPEVDLTAARTEGIIREVTAAVGRGLLPVMAASVGAGLLASYVQVGFLLTGHPLSPNLARLNPVSGAARLFSRRALAEMGKAMAKVTAVGVVAYWTLAEKAADFPAMMGTGIDEAAGEVGRLVRNLFWRGGAVLLFLGFIDYLYQRWEHEQGLRMSSRELKDELKETEGSPELRARVRQRQRQIARRRMMADVAKADVVVTNPVHYAVALRYEIERMEAPQVVGKGRGEVARRIREVAESHGVPVVESPPLAQSLYLAVDVGRTIPPQFYQAVAELLAFVYRLKRKD